MAPNAEGQCGSALTTAPDQLVRHPDGNARKNVKNLNNKLMTIRWITMREYNGGSENIACYKAFLRTDSNRDSNTASDHYCFLCFISLRRGLSSSMRVAGALSITQGTLRNSECLMAIAQVPLNKDA